jgi:hypothetical protein
LWSTLLEYHAVFEVMARSGLVGVVGALVRAFCICGLPTLAPIIMPRAVALDGAVKPSKSEGRQSV